MRITKLVLHRYKRLMQSNIQHFEITPKQVMQLIVGTNGAGKSSVLEEMTPLPTHHSDFAQGGYKEVHLTHLNSQYLLRSTYNRGSGEHSFKKDGEELNAGGTFAIQRDLVYQEFRLNRDIHELLIGVTKFTDLSTAKRREWLTLLSPVDLTYALEVYQRVKTTHRDQVGVIKHITKRMAQENHDLPDDNQLTQYRQEIRQLTQKLDQLFQMRRANTRTVFRTDGEFREQFQHQLREAVRLLKTHPQLPPGLAIRQEADLQALLEDLRGQYRSQEALLERLTQEHQQLASQAPARDAELTDEQILELRQQVEALTRQEADLRHRLESQTLRFPMVDLPPEHRPLELLTATFNDWIALINSAPDNADARFTREKGQKAQERLKALEQEHYTLERQANTWATRLARLRGCETVECPQCTHSFRPGVNPTELTDLEAKLEANGQRIEVLDRELQGLREYLTGYEEYLGYIHQFRRLTQDRPLFRPVWDYCIEHSVMVRQPRNYLQEVVDWYSVMQLQIRLTDLKHQREALTHRLRYVEAIDREALTRTDVRRKELEQEIAHLTDRQRELGQTIRDYTQVGRDLKRHHQALVTARERLESLLQDLGAHQEHLLQEGILEETRTTQIYLAQLQEKLSRAELRETLLQDIEKQYKEAMAAQQEYQLLSKALSTTDGLIGRYLMGFMQVVVKFINAVIAEIWTYPLEVLPSRVEKDELDYKFPLSVNDGAVVAPDIGRGSSSQRDIVNFAFKLLVMKFLKLDHYPLYLDEFGNTFDEQHRFNLIPFINRMVETGQVNQVFYISHFNTVHGAFNQADVCVLDPTNITVPKDYNQHVVLK